MTPPTNVHRCPGGCGRTGVPNRMFACAGCWSRLPASLRDPINALHGRDRNRHADAMAAARDWYLDHPSPRDPDAAVAGSCEHCDAELLWLTTATGKRMPVNAAPDAERGNVVRAGHVAGVLGTGAAAAARTTGTPLWLHHAVTCPHAGRWRTDRARPGGRRSKAGRS